MYPDLQKELATFERRTPKSAEAHKKNLKRIPLGVASNYRAYDPWPIFVKEASGSKFRDLDGNEYIDYNLTFGALMAGHCHPAVMKAVEKRLSTGTMYGMPHTLEYDLADEICQRFPVEQVRFGSSGTEVTMHAIRIARGYTGKGLGLQDLIEEGNLGLLRAVQGRSESFLDQAKERISSRLESTRDKVRGGALEPGRGTPTG